MRASRAACQARSSARRSPKRRVLDDAGAQLRGAVEFRQQQVAKGLLASSCDILYRERCRLISLNDRRFLRAVETRYGVDRLGREQ